MQRARVPDGPPIGRGTETTTPGGVQVITSPDGRTTTINDHGRVTTITTSSSDVVTITVNGQRVTDGREITAAIARIATTSQAGGASRLRGTGIRVNGHPLSENDILAGAAAAGGAVTLAAVVVLYLLGRIVRLFRRRPRTTRNDTSPRLDRIEHAVEAIAIEVERVSEAQRFSAKLLAERLPEAPVAGRPTPERVITPR